MAALTRAQLTTQLRERLGEPLANAWTDTELQNWMYEGVRDIAIRTECCQYRAEVVVDEGVYLIAFPSWTNENMAVWKNSGVSVGSSTALDPQVIRISRCEWVDDSSDDLTALTTALVTDALGNTYDVNKQVYPLEYRSLSGLDSARGSGQQTVEGTPASYALWGQSGSMKIVLYPRPAQVGHLRVYFYGIPAQMSADNATTGLPIGWEHLVLEYGQYKAHLRDQNELWQAAKQEYEMHVAMFMEQFNRLSLANEPVETDIFWNGFDEFEYGGYW